MDYTRIKSHEEVRKEIERMKKDRSPEAIEEARQGLIRTGVLDENGNPKERICNGDYYGW